MTYSKSNQNLAKPITILFHRRVSRVQSRRGSFAVLKDQLKAGLNKASGIGEKTVRAPSPPKQYRVAMLGASGVGKSSLTSQFLSSDHMNTYDSVGKIWIVFFSSSLKNVFSLRWNFPTSLGVL
jgi:hypothetical protein